MMHLLHTWTSEVGSLKVILTSEQPPFTGVKHSYSVPQGAEEKSFSFMEA